MPDWVESMTPEDREVWDQFVERFRREALEQITDSAACISLVPEDGFDVKFATELGAMIMLDKPIIAVAMGGRQVPPKLRLVADAVVEGDIDTEEGRAKLASVISRVMKEVAEP